MKVLVKKKAISTTALISMTDVVFLLLIFLLITSNFITYTGINVPTSQNAHSEIKQNLRLSINEDEQIFINGQMTDKVNLIPALKVEIDKNPDVVIMIEADQNIALQKVVDLIDAAKSAGSSKFFIAAQR